MRHANQKIQGCEKKPRVVCEKKNITPLSPPAPRVCVCVGPGPGPSRQTTSRQTSSRQTTSRQTTSMQTTSRQTSSRQTVQGSAWYYHILGAKYLVIITNYQVLGNYLVPKYLVLGTKYKVPSTWYQEPSTCYQVPSTW